MGLWIMYECTVHKKLGQQLRLWKKKKKKEKTRAWKTQTPIWKKKEEKMCAWKTQMPIKSDPNGQYKCLALLLLTRPSLFLDTLVTTQMGCAIPKNIRALL